MGTVGVGGDVAFVDAASSGGVETVLSPAFSVAGILASKGIEVRSGTSTLLGVPGSGCGFAAGGVLDLTGGH